MQARTDLVTILTGILPTTYTVEPYARNVGNIADVTVMLRLDELHQSKYAGGHWDVDAALLIVGPDPTPGAGDDSLEAALEDVLFALDSADNLLWSTAKRAVYGQAPSPEFPAFEISIQITTTKES